jgi:hypothetical protein
MRVDDGDEEEDRAALGRRLSLQAPELLLTTTIPATSPVALADEPDSNSFVTLSCIDTLPPAFCLILRGSMGSVTVAAFFCYVLAARQCQCSDRCGVFVR